MKGKIKNGSYIRYDVFYSFYDKDTYSELETDEIWNEGFRKAKCYVCYDGDNRKNTRIKKDVIEKALPSIYNIPVMAEYFEEKKDGEGDYGSHGGKLVMDSDGIKQIRTINPIGTVPHNNNEPKYETLNEKEYLVVDVILWEEAIEETHSLMEAGRKGQSMEIKIENGGNIKNGDLNVFDIKKFHFKSLVVLGDDVTPCFEDSEVVVYEYEDMKGNKVKDVNYKLDTTNLLFEISEQLKTIIKQKDITKKQEEGVTFMEKKVESVEIVKLQADFDALQVKFDDTGKTLIEKDATIAEFADKVASLETSNSELSKELEAFKLDESKRELTKVVSEFEEDLKDNAEFSTIKDSVEASDVDTLTMSAKDLASKFNILFAVQERANRKDVKFSTEDEAGEDIIPAPRKDVKKASYVDRLSK